LEKLENLHYEDIKGLGDQFNPSDLIDDDDEDDGYYLAEYNLQADKIMKDRAQKQEKQKLEQYGALKSKSPTKYAQIYEQKVGHGQIPTNGYYQGPQKVSNSNSMQKKYLMPESTKNDIRNQNYTYLSSEASDVNYLVSPVMNTKANRKSDSNKRGVMSTQIIDRANEIDYADRMKEQQRMKNLMQIQDNQIKKGMSVLYRK